MIRPSTQEDLPLLSEIWEEAVSVTHNFLSNSDFAEIKTRLPEYFDNSKVYIYEENGALKGFLGITGDNIDMLFVRERGTGIGTALLGFAVENGACRVDVNEQNHKARSFYGKHGFEVCGRSETDGSGMPYPLLHLKL